MWHKSLLLWASPFADLCQLRCSRNTGGAVKVTLTDVRNDVGAEFSVAQRPRHLMLFISLRAGMGFFLLGPIIVPLQANHQLRMSLEAVCLPLKFCTNISQKSAPIAVIVQQYAFAAAKSRYISLSYRCPQIRSVLVVQDKHKALLDLNFSVEIEISASALGGILRIYHASPVLM
jgi:hypothetical protein